MAFLPVLAEAGSLVGTAANAANQYQAQKFNSQVATNEANLSVNQANAQEGQVRRASAMRLGSQKAAFGAAGVGYGGSSETSLDQSATNQELDALNTRYKGTSTAYGYGVQAGQDKEGANQENLTAGAALLKGIGSNYTYTPTQTYNPQSGSG